MIQGFRSVRHLPSAAAMHTVSAGHHGRFDLLRVFLFYLLGGAVVWVMVTRVPLLGELLQSSSLPAAAGSDFLGSAEAPVGGAVGFGSTWTHALVGTVSMLGALAIMVPVTWVYLLTRRRRGYHESVVHTLLILPVAVTGIVMIVQNSVALAFSLAGIVAAVRFRTTLEDTKDAVYVFLAIGVGLASGVQALGLALALSVVFNAVVLVLWSTRFGNVYAEARVRPGVLTLGDVLAGPGSGAASIRVGDPRVLEALRHGELVELAERASRMETYIEAERRRPKEDRSNALLLVTTDDPSEAQRHTESVLENATRRWKFAELIPAGKGRWVLEYLLHAGGDGMAGRVAMSIQDGDGVLSVELRSLKGLGKRA